MISIQIDSRYELDGVEPGTAIEMKFKAADFSEVNQRGGTLSNSFEVAKTVNNRRFFENAGEVTSVPNRAYRLFACAILEDGNVLFEGGIYLEEVTRFSYKLRIIGQGETFFAAGKKRSIKTIPLDSLRHNYVAAEVNNRRQPNFNLTYPNVNYGRYTRQTYPVGGVDFKNFFPAVKAQYIIERFAAEQGLTYISHPRLEDVLIPFSGPKFNCKAEGVHQAESTTTQSASGSVPEDLFLGLVTNDEFNLFTANSGNGITTLNLLESDVVLVRVQATITADAGNFGNSRMEITDGQARYATFGETQPGETREVNEIVEISVPAGTSSITAYLELNAGGSTNNVSVAAGVTWTIMELKYHPALRQTLKPEQVLPDVTVEDLLVLLATRLQALIVVSKTNSTVKFVRYEDIANDQGRALDLSDFLVDATQVEVEYKLKGYAQSNYYFYAERIKEDPSGKAAGADKGVIYQESEIQDSEKDFYESEFASTGRYESFSSVDDKTMTIIPLYSDPGLLFNKYDLEPGPRIVDIDRESNIFIKIDGEAAPPQQTNVKPVTFREHIADNYGRFQEAMRKPVIVTVDVYISRLQIKKLEYTRLVYLLDAYFYVLEIRGYKIGETSASTLKLLKV